MKCNGYVKFYRSSEAEELLSKYPSAFLLLCQIVLRARWKDCPITGLKAGQAWIGDWKKAGLKSRKVYEGAIARLIKCGIADFDRRNKGTIVTLIDNSIFSVSPEEGDINGDIQGTSKEHPRDTNKKERMKTGNEREAAKPPGSLALNFSPDQISKAEHSVKTSRPEWDLPFSDKEQSAFDSNLKVVVAIKTDEWEIIRRYLVAKFPQGTGNYQPTSRERFILDIGDVRTQAMQWDRKTQPPAKPKPKPQPDTQNAGEEMTPEEIKAFFANKPLLHK